MLQGRRIAVPESRELDLFAGMLERQGAIAVRCPLVSIHDVDDAALILAWLERLAGGQQDSLVLYTGEGLARLLGFARRGGIEAEVDRRPSADAQDRSWAQAGQGSAQHRAQPGPDSGGAHDGRSDCDSVLSRSERQPCRCAALSRRRRPADGVPDRGRR